MQPASNKNSRLTSDVHMTRDAVFLIKFHQLIPQFTCTSGSGRSDGASVSNAS
jgi:hypothetical protein